MKVIRQQGQAQQPVAQPQRMQQAPVRQQQQAPAQVQIFQCPYRDCTARFNDRMSLDHHIRKHMAANSGKKHGPHQSVCCGGH